MKLDVETDPQLEIRDKVIQTAQIEGEILDDTTRDWCMDVQRLIDQAEPEARAELVRTYATELKTRLRSPAIRLATAALALARKPEEEYMLEEVEGAADKRLAFAEFASSIISMLDQQPGEPRAAFGGIFAAFIG